MDCAGNFGQSCLHKLSSTTKIEVVNKELNSDAQILLLQLAFFELEPFRLRESIYHPKIPRDFNRQFLKYKSDLRLHILKDQFLI